MKPRMNAENALRYFKQINRISSCIYGSSFFQTIKQSFFE